MAPPCTARRLCLLALCLSVAAAASSPPDFSASSVLARKRGSLVACYQRALKDDPLLQGKVVVELDVAPKGDVSAARISSPSLGSLAFEVCLLQALRTARFPPADEPAHLTVPFFFHPGN